MIRTLGSNSRRFVPGAIGAGALMAGFLLLQVGTVSDSSANTNPTEFAAARGSELTASRGAPRSTGVLPGDVTSTTAVPAGFVAQSNSAVDLLAAQQATTTTNTTATTAAPPTTQKPATTTTKPKKKPAPPAPKKPVADNPPSGDGVWERLAKCESGMRNDQGAPYYGYFQFSAQTWNRIGGSGLPSDHPYEVQLEFAKKLQERSGWGQWPHCGKVANGG